ncbi:hypothetical protein THAOC_22216, partial [Thalassiosira oceanica]
VGLRPGKMWTTASASTPPLLPWIAVTALIKPVPSNLHLRYKESHGDRHNAVQSSVVRVRRCAAGGSRADIREEIDAELVRANFD